MKIKVDKLETDGRINALGLKKNFVRGQHCLDMYFDTDLGMYIVVMSTQRGAKYSGKVMVHPSQVAASQVAFESVPKHQPIGTPDERDTPSGKQRKHRTDKTAKKAIAERIEAREASKESQD